MRQTGLLRRGEATSPARDGAAPVPLDAALGVVMAHCRPLPAIEVELEDALGSVLAADAVARLDVPRFDNSAMDGFALRSTTISGQCSVLQLAGTTTAGQGPLTLGTGAEAVYVATGAPLPEHADAVVEQELVQFREDRTISVLGDIAPGATSADMVKMWPPGNRWPPPAPSCGRGIWRRWPPPACAR